MYDAIIIGSGMGGLVSAVILAKEGKNVCVLEKNNQYGGNLQTFARDKTIFDTGVHYIGGLDKGQNLYHLFKYLDILEDIQLEKMDINAYDYIHFEGDDKSYPHAQGYDNFIAQLSHIFPNEKLNIIQYCDKVREVCEAFPLYNLKEGSPYDMNILSLNLKDYLDQLTENETLKAVLAGSNLLYAGNKDTPFYVHALSVNSYIQSAWRCIKGGSQISKALVKQLRKYKGDIFKRTEIQDFIYQNDALIGVRAQDGREFFGKTIISNIDLNATIQLAGEPIYKKSLRNRVKNLEDTPSSFSLHIVFKPNTFPYLNHNIYHFKNKESVWEASEKGTNEWPQMYMISMGTSQKNLKYAESMTVMTYMDFELVKKWENTTNTVVNKNDRGESYKDFKEACTNLLLDELEKKFPGIQEKILSTYSTTPLSYRDYIGGRNGNMYGFKKDSDYPLKTLISPRTKIPNLLVTGQSVNMHGIMGVTIGAVNTCSEILGRKHLLQSITKEINETFVL